tara:strand:+ start:537 stop:923 length:387 start_codon:yes stop_codon:yes gene_type:complete
MKLNQLNASSFAEEIGVQASSVSHILSGRNKPSLEFIQKVLLRYPKVDANWLINGVTKPPPEPEQLSLKENDTSTSNSEGKQKHSQELPSAANSSQNEPEEKSQTSTNQRIKKIIVLYTDATFEEFLP